MSELFPNAYGLKLWAIIACCLIVAACMGAFLHSLYELWIADRPKKKVYELDEFEDRDDPYAVIVPRETMMCGVRIVYFQNTTSMYDWATDNIPNIHMRAQFTLETQHLFEYNDKVGFLMGIVTPDMMKP